MNILIYTQKSSYLGFSVGGAETSLRMLAEKLAGAGHTVVYLTEMKRGRFYKHKMDVINGVHVHYVGFPDLPSKGINFLLRLREKLIEYCFYKTAEKLIRKYEIDLVHTYHEVPAMYRFLKLRDKTGLNYATVLRNGGKFWVEKLKKNPELFDSYRTVFNGVDAVNFNTPGMQNLFEDACVNMKMDVQLKGSFVQDIGLDLNQINSLWKYPDKEPFTMVMASRFSTHQKRQKLLVEAVSLLPEDIPFRLFLIGDGPEKKSTEELIRKKGLSEQVEIKAYMPQQELWELVAGAHLYVHACDFEGLSKIIIETMAMGVPVLASDVAPLNDYLKNDENGFLVENNPQKWASTISNIYQNSRSLVSISRTAKSYIHTHYLAAINVKKYIKYFEKLIMEERR